MVSHLTPMSNRVGKPAISTMSRRHLFDQLTDLPLQHMHTTIRVQAKKFPRNQPVLLRLIYSDRRMVAGATKSIIGLRIGSIEKTARIHKNIFPAELHVEGEQIVMFMGSHSTGAGGLQLNNT